MGYKAWGAAGVAAAAVGGAASGWRQTAPVREWAERLAESDATLLDSGHQLPPIPEPDRPQPRTQRSLLFCYGVGLGAGVVIGAVLVFVAIVIFSVASGTPIVQGIVLGGVFGVMGGIGGFFIPGMPIAVLLWLSEVRARIRETITATRHEVWRQREERRAALSEGRADPALVAMELRGLV